MGQSQIVKAGLEKQTFLFFCMSFTFFVFPGTFRNTGKAIRSSFLKPQMLRQLLDTHVGGESPPTDKAERKQASWVAKSNLLLSRQQSQVSPTIPLLRICLLALFRMS